MFCLNDLDLFVCVVIKILLDVYVSGYVFKVLVIVIDCGIFVLCICVVLFLV